MPTLLRQRAIFIALSGLPLIAACDSEEAVSATKDIR